MYAEFSENLITGNEMIDSQHKELIEKMNQLLESCENGNDKLTAVKTLDYLEDYTDYHSRQNNSCKEISTIRATKSILRSTRYSRTPSRI